VCAAGARAAVVLAVVAVPVLAGCGSAVRRTATVVGAPTALAGVSGRIVGAPQPQWLVADAVGVRVPLYAAPRRHDPHARVLPNPTTEGMPLSFLVRQVQGTWLQVQLAARPNGATAWIPRSAVRLRTERYRIEVRLSAHRLRVFRGRGVVTTMAVAVGTPESPTPTGHFFVDARVRLLDPTGPYGAGQVSVTGFSNVYQTFGGGIGQIAIHGTDQPNLIGQGVSHGCVRVTNPQILRLLATVPTGAPVDILP
jgi:lipoprotein-anchoring transpeptidase ErfK/SrfK